jgi:hypothetical protein
LQHERTLLVGEIVKQVVRVIEFARDDRGGVVRVADDRVRRVEKTVDEIVVPVEVF